MWHVCTYYIVSCMKKLSVWNLVYSFQQSFILLMNKWNSNIHSSLLLLTKKTRKYQPTFMLELHSFASCNHREATATRVGHKSMKDRLYKWTISRPCMTTALWPKTSAAIAPEHSGLGLCLQTSLFFFHPPFQMRMNQRTEELPISSQKMTASN